MLPGVYTATKKDKTVYYRSSITYKGKHISLGSFSTERKANQAYNDAKKLFESCDTIEDFSNKKTVLEFKKWVSIINFRDNKIYIKTPIFLQKNFFYYYFDKDDYLTFDNEDLFYYSSHTISRRGGHLFVADYGMQVNILTRYGIKNFGVAGRDYRFANGNEKDFRYENIEIVNRYHGVSKIDRNGKVIYKTKIHINGDYLVGKYSDEITAAVAYNKAVSIVIKKGYNKNYPVNYIEELTDEEYHNIYKNVKVAKKIYNLLEK